MDNLYFHIGYPKTGSTTLRHFLFPLHSDINYLGRFDKIKNHLKITEMLVKTKNEDFKKNEEELINLAKSFKILPNKTNLLAEEFIINYSIHYDNEGNHERTIERTMQRAKYIFGKININLKVFFMIRKQSDLIPSFYSNTAPELGKSMTYDANEIIKYFKNQSNNYETKRFCDGLKFNNLFLQLQKIFNKENLRVFVFDEAISNFNNYIFELSNYLKIDPQESLSLVKNKSHFSSKMYINEDLRSNSPINVLSHKILRSIFEPGELFFNLHKKFLIAVNLVKQQFSDDYKENKEKIKKRKINFLNQYCLLKSQSELIQKYYKEDTLELEKNIKKNLKKLKYY